MFCQCIELLFEQLIISVCLVIVCKVEHQHKDIIRIIIDIQITLFKELCLEVTIELSLLMIRFLQIDNGINVSMFPIGHAFRWTYIVIIVLL